MLVANIREGVATCLVGRQHELYPGKWYNLQFCWHVPSNIAIVESAQRVQKAISKSGRQHVL